MVKASDRAGKELAILTAWLKQRNKMLNKNNKYNKGII
jgi:hypothetical protein